MTCDNCLDTGHGDKGLSPYLDCTRCEVATIRARLNDKFPLAAKLYPDSLWGAYNEGKAAAELVAASEAGIPASVQQDRQDAEPVDTKLLVDIATGVMDKFEMLAGDSVETQWFCEDLKAAFDAALASRKEPKPCAAC